MQVIFFLVTLLISFSPYPTNSTSYQSIDVNFDLREELSTNVLIPVEDAVILQSFYWMTPDIGQWWNMLKNHVSEFAEVGITALWTPPPSKSQSGDAGTNGYEPYDYYDLGEFDQKGRIRTRYGTRQELESFIAEANNQGIAVITDAVINHNVGGEPELNPYVEGTTFTNFENISSGRFPRNYSHFYPNEYGTEDNYQFANFPDLCHKHPYVHDELIEWGKWLRDEIGFDGWRFDVALGIDVLMLHDWMQEVGGWGVAEYWGGTYDDLENYIRDGNDTFTAFDFHLMYQLRLMAIGRGFYDMRNLRTEGILWDYKPTHSTTFIKNHDTVRSPEVHIDQNEHMTYAYILTHEGFPTIFWNDYFDLDLQPHLKALIKIHNNYAKGGTQILFVDNDLYIMQRSGDPGLILGLNDNPNNWKQVTVTTKWKNTILHDLTGQAPDVEVDSDGIATILVPPMGYAVFSDDNPIAKLYSLPDPATYVGNSVIGSNIINIDGKLDNNWGQPTYVDPLGDAGLNQRDLTNLFVKHDNQSLLLGFGIGRTPWSRSNLHYGIAIDVEDGGNRYDPWTHEKIMWAGDYVPDHIYYIDATPEESGWGKIEGVTQFSVDSSDEWEAGETVNTSAVQFNPILGFIEMKIPLEEINLETGGNVSLMVFSTVADKLGAVDSIPNDRYTDGFGDIDSWLTLPAPLMLKIKSEADKTSSEFFFTVFGLFFFSLIVRRKKNSN
jgi:alpha-amylase